MISNISNIYGRNDMVLVPSEKYYGSLGIGKKMDKNIIGLQVDYENRTFTRLESAFGLSAGSDFDKFEMFGGRKRCNVLDDGTISAWYGEENYIEDGTNGQVMVYQPKFYYKVEPLKIEEQIDGIGYHLRKANYYVTSVKQDGFKLHPVFYNEQGKEVDYVLFSAYEGSIFDVSENTQLLNDEQIADFNVDKFCSVSNAKPASGVKQQLTRPNIESLAQNRGNGWHGDFIKAESANQLLMIIEMGMMNLQSAIGCGIVQIVDDSKYNCSSLTGSTSNIGNEIGMAKETINTKGELVVTETTNGRTSITYRGVENPFGNIWKFVYGVNIWGNGSMKGGVPYICNDFNFAESKNSGNYESAGFTVANVNSYISAMGYGGEKYDWLFFASECLGNSSVPVGDYHWITQNLNGYRVALLGGRWADGSLAGGFYWALDNGVGARNRHIGGRLVYVPTKATATSYASNITAWKQKMVA